MRNYLNKRAWKSPQVFSGISLTDKDGNVSIVSEGRDKWTQESFLRVVKIKTGGTKK